MSFYIAGWRGGYTIKSPTLRLKKGGVSRDHHLFCGLVGPVPSLVV